MEKIKIILINKAKNCDSGLSVLRAAKYELRATNYEYLDV